MKKTLLSCLLAVSILSLAGCDENMKTRGNKMNVGSYTYYYALVYSDITDTKYYHIKGWAEYGPEGGDVSVMGIKPYVGLELQLVNDDVIYRYEPGLAYELMKNYNANYGPAIGD